MSYTTDLTLPSADNYAGWSNRLECICGKLVNYVFYVRLLKDTRKIGYGTRLCETCFLRALTLRKNDIDKGLIRIEITEKHCRCVAPGGDHPIHVTDKQICALTGGRNRIIRVNIPGTGLSATSNNSSKKPSKKPEITTRGS